MMARGEDECNSCGAFGTSEQMEDPAFHESNCPHAIPEPDERQLDQPNGALMAEPKPLVYDPGIPGAEVHDVTLPPGPLLDRFMVRSLQGRVYLAARRGYMRRLRRQAIEWAYIGHPDLRIRLLYAKLEPWGA